MIQQAWSGRGCWHRVREHEPCDLPPLEAETVTVDVDRTFDDAGVSGEVHPGDVGLLSEQFSRLLEGESLGGAGGRSAKQRLGSRGADAALKLHTYR